MTKIIILAAGKGTRMKTELAKVLVTLFDRPLIRFVIEAVNESGLGRPLVVVGHQADLVRAIFGDDLDYILQAEQLGTGHAVACAKDTLKDKCDSVLVLNGDMPFVSPETMKKIQALHESTQSILTMATSSVPDYKDWRQSLQDHGRILRNQAGQIIDIREFRDATDAEKEIKEVNPSCYCFNASWLWENISKLKNINAKKEYYLTDLVKLAFDQRQKISTLSVDPVEAVGINTPEQLKLAETLLQKRIVR